MYSSATYVSATFFLNKVERNFDFNNLDFFSNHDMYDWLKLGVLCLQAFIFSADVWWWWRHLNSMFLNNETWFLNRMSFNIWAMVETFRNCFSHASNDGLVDRLIKRNNNNYSCSIFNVDWICLGSIVRYEFCGIIRNTFDYYLAGFVQRSSDICLLTVYYL
jgi:hypothetical protein